MDVNAQTSQDSADSQNNHTQKATAKRVHRWSVKMTEDGRRILSRQNNGENEAQQKSNTDGKFFIFFFTEK